MKTLLNAELKVSWAKEAAEELRPYLNLPVPNAQQLYLKYVLKME